MNKPSKLERRVHAWQLGASLATATLIAFAVPPLLLIRAPTRWQLSGVLFGLSLLGTVAATLWTWQHLRRHRPLLKTLASKQPTKSAESSVDDMIRLATEPSRLTRGWLLPQVLALSLLLGPFRPDALGVLGAIAVFLLAAVMLATASLPMHVMVRRDVLDVVERAPVELMRRVIGHFSQRHTTRGRINRRIVIAVTTPVIFVALGSALIVNAHLRLDDESSREETARMLAQGVLDHKAGEQASLRAAATRAAALGFPVELAPDREGHGLKIEQGAIATLRVPSNTGSTVVRFNASTVGIVGIAPTIVSLLAALSAAILGFLLGNVLSMDLYFATRGVRMLGASSAAMHQHTGVLRPPRLRLIAELAGAIDALTVRFGVFAQAQEGAIRARSTAVRARGLFFASVSHDLKSPLNSILGFIQLVSMQPLTPGQQESVEAIETRARELLALIETILDAARVEEGQLSLVTDEVEFQDLHEAAIDKALQLSSGFKPKIFEEIESDIPPLLVDRTRVVRALATLIAYSVRSNEGGKMWIRAEREDENSMRIDIDVPHPVHSPEQLERMLSPGHEDEQREHRGLALGLRLARSVVKLHRGGSVRVVDRGKKGAMFCVKMPTLSEPIPSASAPLHSIPPPPMPPELQADAAWSSQLSGSAPGGHSDGPPSSARPRVGSAPPPPLVPSSAPPGSWKPPSAPELREEDSPASMPPPPVLRASSFYPPSRTTPERTPAPEGKLPIAGTLPDVTPAPLSVKAPPKPKDRTPAPPAPATKSQPEHSKPKHAPQDEGDDPGSDEAD